MTYPIQDEKEAVHRVEQALAQYGPFVSLAEAARQTGVHLATLADAVRHQRIPALRVQKQRWLVRISAVQAYLSQDNLDSSLALANRLKANGLLDEAQTHTPRVFAKVQPVNYAGDRTLSEWITEERR